MATDSIDSGHHGACAGDARPDAIAPDICEDPFLIIAGSYRCGSTGLFQHLGAHPSIVPSRTKETGFFMPLSMRAGPPYPPTYGHSPFASYLTLFEAQSADAAELKLEATPTYLHVREAAQRIHSALPNARILISLRDPVSRLVSWFQTLKLLRMIDDGLSFDDFLGLQRHDSAPPQRTDFVYRARQHGLFSVYVRDYMDIFGPDRVKVIFLEDLVRAPESTLSGIANFAGITPDFYRDYQPRRVNRARQLRHPQLVDGYLAMRRGLRAAMPRWRMIRRPLAWLRRRLEPKYYAMISRPAASIELTTEQTVSLTRFYLPDVTELANLLGRNPPWSEQYHHIARHEAS